MAWATARAGGQIGARGVELDVGAGDARRAGVNRVGGVGSDGDVAAIEHGQAEVAHALLGAHRDDELALGVEARVVATLVPARRGLAQREQAAAREVAVVLADVGGQRGAARRSRAASADRDCRGRGR